MTEADKNFWRKSSRSNPGGNCVEVGQNLTAILVRDTTNRAGAQLKVTSGAWKGFLASVKE